MNLTGRVMMAAFAVWMTCAVWTCPEALAADQDAAPAAVLDPFIRSKGQEVDGLQRDLGLLQSAYDKQEAEFLPVLENARSHVQALDVMARMVKTNPYDMRVALAEAKFLQLSLAKHFQPMELMAKDLALKAVTIQALQEDLERKWSVGLDKELKDEITPIRKNIIALSQSVRQIQTRMEKTNGAVGEVQGKVQEWITTFEAQLPLIWKAEFLDPTRFVLLPAPGMSLRQEMTDWSENLKAFMRSQVSSMGEGYGDWGGTLLLFWLPFMLLGMGSHKYLSDMFDNDNAGGRRASALAILCLSLGLSLLAAFMSGKVKQTSLLLVVTHVLMLLGVQALAWLFRNVRGVLRRRSRQALLPVVFLSVCVAVLDLLRLPVWIEHLLWVLMLVLSSLFFGLSRPELRYERLVQRVHPYVLSALVTAAVLGWSNLATLASTMWGVLALAVQLGIGSSSVVRVVFERLHKPGLRALVADLSETFLTLFVWLAVGLGVMAWITINLGTNAVVEKLSSMELNWGDFSFNFLRLGAVALLFQVVRSLAAAWKAMLDGENLHWKSIDRGAAASLQRIGVYCLWLLYCLVSLNLLGISLANFAVIAGGLSVGIGFGMQTMISNFISGLILLFDRSIQPGDVIEIGGQWVRVESVNIRNTVVQTFDNAKIFVPNSELIAAQVTNWTHRNDVRIRRDISVGVAYGSDVALVKRVLIEAATEHPGVLATPEPWVIFSNFGASSLDFVLRFWVRHVDLSVSAPSEIREVIDARFREYGIEIPFAQMDLHLRPGDGTLQVRSE